MSACVRGVIFVVDDNIDTDQIIPAEYLTLVPSKPDEYEKLGSYAMAGLPERYGEFVPAGEMKTPYPIIVAGENFGCGSSREHAPIALGAAGVKAVVAQSYARIFSAIVLLQENYTLGSLSSGCAIASKLGKKFQLILTIIKLSITPSTRYTISSRWEKLNL